MVDQEVGNGNYLEAVFRRLTRKFSSHEQEPKAKYGRPRGAGELDDHYVLENRKSQIARMDYIPRVLKNLLIIYHPSNSSYRNGLQYL